jgi:hypothetical protein
VSLVFIGCSKDESTEYYSVLGTVVKTDDSTLVVSDEDERLLVNNAGSLTGVADNDRVIVYFSIAEEQLPAGIDYVIEVYNYTIVLYKPVLELTDEIMDSIGNDPIAVRDIWLAKDYLNVNFEYYGNTQTHLINLIRFPGEIATDTIQLEIRHNDKDDAQNVILNGLVSFDLKSLKNEGDSVVLHIKAREYNNQMYEKNFTYKF